MNKSVSQLLVINQSVGLIFLVLYIHRLMNIISPGSVAANKLSKPPTMPFKQMELIQYFVGAVRNYGVADHENFATVDLHESQNLNQVVTCLQALGRKVRPN